MGIFFILINLSPERQVWIETKFDVIRSAPVPTAASHQRTEASPSPPEFQRRTELTAAAFRTLSA